MTDPPPELAAAVIAVTAHDNHWVAHGAGAFSLEQVLSLSDGFEHLDDGLARGLLVALTARGRLRPGFEELPVARAQETVVPGSRLPYREWLEASEADDPLWRPLRLQAALEKVEVPVLLHEGWQDRFVDQMIDQYERLRQRGVQVGLLIGPWTHIETGTKGARLLMEESLEWFAEHLAGAASEPRQAPVRIFLSGAGEWRELAEWPPTTMERVLYLHPGGKLAETEPPPEAEPSSFVYDPTRPTPAIGGRVINPSIGGYRDNRKLEARSDVLTFTSAPLVEPLDVIGNPSTVLAHQTDNPYADLFVRLCEVREDGRSVNLSDGFRRLEPEQSSGTVTVRLEAMAHRFQPGTRIRLQVSGGAHPRYARNLGTNEDPATGTSLAPSRRKICHGADGVSRVLLPGQIPAEVRPQRPPE
jgi:putative CocE/NonD family hydrolase